MHHLRWNALPRHVRRRHQTVDCERAEHALVGKRDQEVAGRTVDPNARPQVSVVCRIRGAQQHLTAHAQVRAQRLVPPLERHPQELAPTRDGLNARTFQGAHEVSRVPGMAAQGTLVEHLDGRHGCTRHRGCKAEANNLDFGQLWHG